MGIEWRESLSVGVDEIDNQHKELLARFDRLLKACETGRGISELKGLLVFLHEYASKHFKDEEAMQKLRNYPGYDSHKKQHEHFITKIKALQSEVDQEGLALHHVMETNNLLLKWLINHISTVDVELGRFLKALKA
jgi:hemerythrin